MINRTQISIAGQEVLILALGGGQQVVRGDDLAPYLTGPDLGYLMLLAQESAAIDITVLRAIEALDQSESLNLIEIKGAARAALAKREIFRKVNLSGFLGTPEQLIDLIVDTIRLDEDLTLVSLKRPESGVKINADQTRVKAAAPAANLEQYSFSAGHVNFECKDSLESTMTRVERFSGKETEILELMGLGIEKLHLNQNDEALLILREIAPRKPENSDLQFAKAVAEARIGLIPDCLGSLNGLLARDPGYAAAKELLLEIRRHLGQI